MTLADSNPFSVLSDPETARVASAAEGKVLGLRLARVQRSTT